MKKYRRRLSVILTFVLILTSIGFTGAFANENNAADGAADQNVQAEEQAVPEAPAADEAPVEDPAADKQAVENTGSGEIPSDGSTATDPAPGDTVTPGESGEQVTPGDSVEPSDSSSEDGQEGETAENRVTITWKNDDGTVLAEDVIEKGTVPAYQGETPVKAEDADYVYEFSGWDNEPVAAEADATYTAQYDKKSKGTIAPEKPVVESFSSFKSIVLEWDAVTVDENKIEYTDEAKESVRYRVRYKKGKNGSWKSWHSVGTALKYHTPKPYTLDPLSTYYFQVEAYTTVDGTEKYSDADSCYDSPVKPMRYKLYIKESGTLTSHYKYNAKKDSYKASGAGKKYVHAGDVVYADRFATGKYMFTEGNYVYYVSRTRVGKKSCVYTTKWNYTPKEIQYFVNDKGVKSKTKYLIMTSTFTQHVYVFKGTKSGSKYKNWKTFTVEKKRSKSKYAYEKDLKKGAVMNWECGTGTASDPTPTSHTGLKETTRWVKVRHSIPWWTKFHGTAAFHGNKIRTNNKGLGKPVSSGCIRNPHERAHWIWDLCKNGTQVVIY